VLILKARHAYKPIHLAVKSGQPHVFWVCILLDANIQQNLCHTAKYKPLGKYENILSFFSHFIKPNFVLLSINIKML